MSIPFFAIHGNHDDPQGVGKDRTLSPLDLLSVAGLLNYFGRLVLPSESASAKRRTSGTTDDALIALRPILLRKGETHIGLYGMGNMKDERISHELRERHVCMFRPAENPDQWFNILTVHQNRCVLSLSIYTARHTTLARLFQRAPLMTRYILSFGVTSTNSG